MSDEIYLDQVNIVTSNMEASAAFYGLLGLDVSDGGMPEWRPHHVDAVGTGGGADVNLDSAAFAAEWNDGWPGAGGVVISFRVGTRDDVDRRYAELTAAGHVGQQAPYDAFWGSRFAVVADPDGNSVALMSPRSDEHRSRPELPSD